jgi:hypothetical protein
MPEPKRSLKVFLCHAHDDKAKTRELYRYLRKRGIQPWLDSEDLVGGQDWRVEIPKAIKTSDAIIICLSKNSINKEGFVQAEITFALEKALEIPPGRIFIIPARFEDCEVPGNLERFHWVDLFEEEGFPRLMKSLRTRAGQLERSTVQVPQPNESSPNLTSLLEEKIESQSALEKADREAVEKAAREKAKREADEQVTREKIARELAEKAVAKVPPVNEGKQSNTLMPKVDKPESKKIKAPNKGLFSIIAIILVLCVSAGFIINQFAQNVFTSQQPSTQTALNPTAVAYTSAAELTLTAAAFTATLLPTETPFITPTKTFTPIPTQVSNLSDNCDNFIWVEDVTIPDGTQMNRSQVFVKTWKIKNSGTCSWGEGYQMIFDSGEKMSGQPQTFSGSIAPGQSVDVSVQFTAPTQVGEYVSIWKMANASGISFGDTLFVKIIIK